MLHSERLHGCMKLATKEFVRSILKLNCPYQGLMCEGQEFGDSLLAGFLLEGAGGALP